LDETDILQSIISRNKKNAAANANLLRQRSQGVESRSASLFPRSPCAPLRQLSESLYVHLDQAYYSYSFEHHVFVLSYWQWRWLFRLLGFEHVASVIEVIGTGEFIPGETVARRDEYRRLPKNQHFILRAARPAAPHTA